VPLQADTANLTDLEDTDPVADFISALVLTGKYRPEMYGIPNEAISRWRKVHEYCLEVQGVVGEAPKPEQVRRRFPNFPFVTDIPAEWASHELHGEYLHRRLAKHAAEITRSLIKGDTAGAYRQFTEAQRRIQPTTAAPIDIFDEALLLESPPLPCPIMPGALFDLSRGGIRPGELWLIGARPNRGKSWDLVRHGIAATLSGWDVVYFSMEMPARKISDRALAIEHTWDKVDGWSDHQRITEARLMRKARGRFRVIDPSVRTCDTMAVAAQSVENTLICVDHIGLMRGERGNRSIEDHRIAASISNELKEISLQYKVPIMAASQLNRRSEGKSEPTLSDLAQTDASGQDSDLVYAITMAFTGSRVQQCTVVKNRNGRTGVRWFNDFLPQNPTFAEVSQQKARTLLEEEMSSRSTVL
jgi:replicative DNA helicase